MRRGRMLAAGLAALALLVGVGVASLRAADPAVSAPPALPPAKQAFEDALAAFQNGGKAPDKSKDAGRPLVVQEDPAPPTGLLGPVAAPMPGGLFTTASAWAGWIGSTYVVVYAGAPSDNPASGRLLVVRQAGASGRLDPNASSDGNLVTPPLPGGPLQIVSFDAGQLVISNASGRTFRFNVSSGVFD